MKSYYHCLFVLLFFCFSANFQAQVPGGSNQPPKVNDLLYNEIFTPKISTPNVAGLGKVNFSNVSEYTGSASINIPIYQIQIGQISVPIELNYSATGIKVDETASNVGQNWSLNAGGIVTKVIKGIEDFKVGIEGNLPYDVNNPKLKFTNLGTAGVQGFKLKEVGWLMQSQNISLNKYYDLGATSIDKVYTVNDMNLPSVSKDLSPDVFYANAPGLNTSFTHRKDGSVMEIAAQGNKISTNVKQDAGQTINQTPIISLFPEFRDNIKFQNDLVLFDGGPARRMQGISKVDITNISGTQYIFDQLDVNQYVNRDIYNSYVLKQSSRDMTSQEVMAYKLSKIKDFKGNEVSFEYEKYAISYPEYRKTSSYEVTNLSGNQLTRNLRSTEIRYPNLNRISKITYAEGSVEFKYEVARKDLPGDYALSRIIIKDINNSIIKTVTFEYDYITSNNNCNEPTCKRLRLLQIQETGKNNVAIPPHRFFYNEDVKLPERGAFITDYLGYANGPVLNGNNNDSSVCGTCLLPPPQLYYLPNKKELSFSPFPIFLDSFAFKTSGRSLEPSLPYTKAGIINKVQYPTGGSEEFEYELNDFYAAGRNVVSGGLRVSLHKLIDSKGALQVKKYNYLDADNNSSGILNSLPLLGIANVGDENLATAYLGISQYTQQSGLTLFTFTNSKADFDIIEGSNVGYSRVLIKENADNGYVEKVFSTRKDFPVEETFFTHQTYDAKKVEFGFKNGWRLPSNNNTELLVGKLKSIRKFDKTNNLVEETKNGYKYDIFSNPINEKVGISRAEVFPQEAGGFEPIEPDFAFYPKIYSSRNLTNETKTTTNYGQNKVLSSSSTTYDPVYTLPKSMETVVNESGAVVSLIKETSYPHNFTTTIMSSLVGLNRIAEPVVVKTTRKTNNVTEDLNSQVITYNTFVKGAKTLILPTTVQAIKGAQTASNVYEDKMQFHAYDKLGNVTEVSKKEDTHTVYLWGYNYTKLIAKIENATYAEVMISLGKTATETLEYLQAYNEVALKNEMQKIRTGLKDAMVSSYVYKPLIGIANVIDPRGVALSYEYDDLNRLKRIKDQDQNIIEEYCYGYSGQRNNCQDAIIPSDGGVGGTDGGGNSGGSSSGDADLWVKIGDFKSYKTPVACGRGIDWEAKLPYGADYKGKGVLNLHENFYFPNPPQIGVDFQPGYHPLPNEYKVLNLPYPLEEYTCNYYAERSGNSFELVGLDNPKFQGPNRVVELVWWMEVDGEKIELPKVREHANVFFIPKCLDGTYGKIVCSAKITSGYVGQEPIRKTVTYVVKSNLMTLKSGLHDYDDVPAPYKIGVDNKYSGDACNRTLVNGGGNTSTPIDPGFWKDTPWTINNGVVVVPDFKIAVEKYQSYTIPVPAWLPTNFTWTGITTPSLHPLFNYPRPTGGIHKDNPFVLLPLPSFITYPYLLEYYASLYVSVGGYKFDRASVLQKVSGKGDYSFSWYIKLEGTGQQIPIIRTLESKDLFFIPPALNGKSGKLICVATKRFDGVTAPLTFESEIITFQQGLSNSDNLNYQVEYLDEVEL
ncbi:hypothetical protein [Flavobacterium poyangense]|uniref:hypothetical protein n=1 Tax=Flavobacterium poyangense TaxID=2204302 RepID=UPI001421A3CA|nr:hypothetical protein [Flavobacterium sp. JXAS1]